MSDAIIQEIRQIRDQLAEQFHYDLHELCEELRREQALGANPIVNLSDSATPHGDVDHGSLELEHAP